MLTTAGVLATVLALLSPCDSGPWTTEFDETIERSVKKYWPLEYQSLACRWKAQLIAESNLDPTARSPVGAQSVAQIMPVTFREIQTQLGITCHPFDAKCSILAGTWYMRTRLDVWAWHRPLVERYHLAAASYNAGTAHILKAQRLCEGALLWEDIKVCLPTVTGRHSAETIGYVNRIGRITHRLRGGPY